MKFLSYKIGDLTEDIKTGKTPSTKNDAYFINGRVNWLTPSDLKGQKIIKESERKITQFAIEENAAFLYKTGTVLVSTIGDIGKTCIVDEPAASNQQLTGILLDDSIILPELFYYWVIRSKKLLNNKANKAVISILNNKLLKKIVITFPSDLGSQRKITTQLNQIQSLIDKRIKSIKILNDLVQSFFVYYFGDPVHNNKSYTLYKIGDVVENILSGWSAQGENREKVKGEYGVLKVSSVTDGEFLPEQHKAVSRSIIKRKLLHPVEGDLLMSRANTLEKVAAVAIVDKTYDDIFLPDKLWKIILNNDEVSTYYFKALLAHKGFRDSFVNKSTSSSSGSMVNITQDKFLNYQFPKPSLNLQMRFESVYKTIEDHKLELKKSLNLLENLFQSVLQNSFGENSFIDEEPIFEELLKDFSIDDLSRNNDRINYLIDFFKQEKFTSEESYTEAIEKLHKLIENKEVKQYYNKKNKTVDLKK